MIVLTVVSYKGQPADGSLVAAFDELGGTIGRSDDNQLVLSDPDRMISRKHAQVVFRNGSYALIDRGSNPVLVNQRPVGNSQEMAIKEGDLISIGGYEIRVSQSRGGGAAKAASDDPFADLLGPAVAFGPSDRKKPAAAPFVDPLSLPPQPPAAAPPPAARASGPSGIPEDWDPFAATGTKPRAADILGLPAAGNDDVMRQFGLDAGAAAPSSLVPGEPQTSQGGDLDRLFGLGPGGGDPLANSVLAPPSANPNMAGHADPMRALNVAPTASSSAAPDNLSDLQRPFTEPPMVVPPGAGEPVVRPRPGSAAPLQGAGGSALPGATLMPGAAGEAGSAQRPLPQGNMPPPSGAARPSVSGAVLSWEDQPLEGLTLIRPAPPRRLPPDDPFAAAVPVAPAPAAPALRAAPAAGAAAGGRAAAAPAAGRSSAASGAPQNPAQPTRPAPAGASQPAGARAPASASADSGELLAAFKRGLGEAAPPIGRLSPELMELIGRLLAESTRGTLELLAARAAVKREIHSDQTMILARENNPLKFSPNPTVALDHLLGPPTSGFMAPERAMRDAWTDLRAHQFATIAGMRAALEGVLGRFDPAHLDARLTRRPVLQALLPGSRKARMWEEFESMYAQIREEASEDFQSLFGKAFLKAYEEHLAMLDGKRKG